MGQDRGHVACSVVRRDAGELSIGENGRVSSASPTAAALLGHTPESLAGTVAVDLVHPDDLTRTFQLNDDDVRLTGATTGRWRLRHRDGSWRPVEAEIRSVGVGFRPGPVGTIDIPGLGRRAIPALHIRVRPLTGRAHPAKAAGSQPLGDGISCWELDLDGGRVTVLGDPWSGGGDTHHELAELQATVPESDLPATPLGLLATLPDDVNVFTAEHRVVGADGPRWYQHRVRVSRDGLGVPVRLRATTTEISAEQRGRPDRDVIDELTGLPGRASAVEHLQAQLGALASPDRDGPGLVGVLSIDLDRFQMVNDSIGRSAGDHLLRQLSTRLHDAVGAGDAVARVGGDEFLVVSTGRTGTSEVVALARSVAAVISEPIWMNGRDLRPTASIGVAVTRRSGSAETLLRDAETAMHQAKATGGNRHELFTPAMRRNVLTHFRLEHELRTAVHSGELRVAYQPIVELDGTITGAEALVRWQHPRRGLLQPADFIPLAEKTGLVGDVGREVLRTACRHTAAWRHLAPTFRVSVNVAAAQLDDPTFAARVERTLVETGLPPQGLCLEITETALMADTTTARTSLQRLGDLGCTVALDDFGTGYSPLLNLRYFPVDVIKLDRYFVAGLERDHTDQAIIGAVIDLAHALDMTTVAEGVETPHQRDILQLLGCDRGQGYLWHRPVGAEAIEGLLTQRDRPAARTCAGADQS